MPAGRSLLLSAPLDVLSTDDSPYAVEFRVVQTVGDFGKPTPEPHPHLTPALSPRRENQLAAFWRYDSTGIIKLPSPSPQPSPLGRGRIVPQSWAKSEALIVTRGSGVQSANCSFGEFSLSAPQASSRPTPFPPRWARPAESRFSFSPRSTAALWLPRAGKRRTPIRHGPAATCAS